MVGVLEEEGVRKFATSWHELLATIETEMAAVRSPVPDPAGWRPRPRDQPPCPRRPVERDDISNPLRDSRDRRIPRVAGPCVLVMFGVTGDLASKKLLPAVYDLANRGLLPPGLLAGRICPPGLG